MFEFKPFIIDNYRETISFDNDNLYIYLTRCDNTFLSKLVSVFTRSIYTHAGIIIDGFDHCLEAIPGVGVRYHAIENFNKNNLVDIYKIKIDLDMNIVKKRQQEFISKVIYAKYDWPSVFRIIFNNNTFKNRKNKYFCSELVYEYTKYVAGIELLKNINAYEVIPKYLGLSPYIIYIGTIDTSEYNK